MTPSLTLPATKHALMPAIRNPQSKIQIPPSVLISPLDWGLGHATRCIPIIRKLIERGCEVTIASDGRPYDLLAREFPRLDLLRLPGYNIAYPTDGSMASAMANQLPKILAATMLERRWLAELTKLRRFDLIISDNRFGLTHVEIPSVYITHQLTIRLPRSMRPFEPALRAFHNQVMRRFTEIWVPDFASEPSLAGELSHPPKIGKNVHYIGPLTRFGKFQIPNSKFQISRDLIVILSGPEPQRTIFEQIVMEQLSNSALTAMVVLGKSEADNSLSTDPLIQVVNHLPAAELETAIRDSKAILSRPGYSTVMDLTAFDKSVIFVPTPGQTEQEYLAERFAKRGGCVVQGQNEFNLKKAWQEVQSMRLSLPSSGTCETIESRLDHLLSGSADV